MANYASRITKNSNHVSREKNNYRSGDPVIVDNLGKQRELAAYNSRSFKRRVQTGFCHGGRKISCSPTSVLFIAKFSGEVPGRDNMTNKLYGI